MLSNHLEEYAQEKYNQVLPFLGSAGEKAACEMAACSEDEQVLMKFLYGTMPVRDAGEYDFSIFLGFVRHALMVKDRMPWCKEIAEDMFLHNILYYRVNSENITDCRRFFYDQLADRIKGKSVREAVIEVNYWCGESAAYEASDNRTISPVTVYLSGKGRCGEESTFAVTALRSVGIPARQVYTPRWAHCDDNHAWVEAYVDGSWCFFGACEPEEILNKGWFTNASSRALLVHTRTFSDYSLGMEQECIGKEDLLVYYNNTSNYALTKNITVKVVDETGEAVENAAVSIEILNMAEFCSVVSLTTDAAGEARLTVGLGDIHIHVKKDRRFTQGQLSVLKDDRVTFVLPDEERSYRNVTEDIWKEIEVGAPVDYPMHPTALTKEQKLVNQQKVNAANRMREERAAGYFIEEKAENYPSEVQILTMAKGNFDEIFSFLSKDSDPDRKDLLHSLSVKDYKDAQSSILEEHLQLSKGLYSQGSREIFVKYVMCPRLYLEEMTAYRSFIKGYFTEDEKRGFLESPESIWDYIKSQIRYIPSLDYKTICATPVGCLKLKQGNPFSQKLLFVAVCRTLGIPARINTVNLEAEYYKGQGFVSVTSVNAAGEKKETGSLILEAEDGSRWSYYRDWTIGRFMDGQFHTLDYTDIKFGENSLCLELEAGIYRIITTCRMPNGNQHAGERSFRLQEGESKHIFLSFREGDISDMLVHLEIGEFELTDENQNKVSVTKLTKDKANILMFLEEGKEPTEHVLNEMLEQKNKLCSMNAQLICIVKHKDSLSNRTLAKTLEAIPDIRVFYDKFTENAETLARRMYVDPEKLPLLAVTNPGMTGIYGCSGYHVGSVDLVIKILERSYQNPLST